LCGFAPPHFAVAGLCYAKPLFATAKRQLPVTLNKRRKVCYNYFTLRSWSQHAIHGVRNYYRIKL